MRILMTTDTVGGVWTFTQELTQGLLEGGHAVALMSFGRVPSAAQSSWVEAVKAAHGAGFCYESSAAPLEWMEANADVWSLSAPELRALAKSFGPDVIHCNQFCYGALESTTPTLVTAHSDVLSWARACRLGRLEESAWLERYKALVQTGLDGAAAVIAPTAWMLNALSEGFQLPACQGMVPNGRTPTLPTGRSRLLQAASVGRFWDEAKHVDLLTGLATRMPIMLAGEGAPAAESNAIHLGPLGELEVLTLFSESSVYICSSRYEPFGLAPLEAALCGCAIIARDLASLREVWGEAALYFEDTAGLERLLEELYCQPELLLKRRQISTAHAERFSRARMTQSYLEWYRRVAERGLELSHVA